MTFGFDRSTGNRLAFLNRRQSRIFVFQLSRWVVRALYVGPEKAREVDRPPGDLEYRTARLERDLHAVSAGVCHLAGNRPLPHHVKQFELVVLQFLPQRFRQLEGMTGRPNGLVRFLCVLDFGMIYTRLFGQEIIAVFRSDKISGGVHGDLCQTGRVGSHVRNVPVFIQALGQLHCAAGRVSQLSVRLLLHRTRRKGRIRLSCVRLDLQIGNMKLLATAAFGQFSRLLFVH